MKQLAAGSRRQTAREMLCQKSVCATRLRLESQTSDINEIRVSFVSLRGSLLLLNKTEQSTNSHEPTRSETLRTTTNGDFLRENRATVKGGSPGLYAVKEKRDRLLRSRHRRLPVCISNSLGNRHCNRSQNLA